MTTKFTPSFQTTLKRRIDAAQGKIPCDIILKDIHYLDVFSAQWRQGDISIIDGVIVGLEPGLKAKQVLSCRGKWLVPGFIDAHVHLESSLMVPRFFEEAVLTRGTTSAICDPHELANVVGPQGIDYFLKASEKLRLDLWVMMSSCVPATHLETNGGGTILADQLLHLANHPKALGLAEMMNVPGILNGDPELLKKLEAFWHQPKDGHCPLVRGQALSAYATAGLSSCHESSQLEEAQEKITKGISVWIREGSVAKDLDALWPLLNMATSTSIGFCTDDRNPLDIAEQGHLDYLVRSVLQKGIPSEIAYRSASWTVAKHYGLAQGQFRFGAIAPGFQADLIILDDAQTCAIHRVLKAGQWADEDAGIKSKVDRDTLEETNTIRAIAPEEVDLQAPQGNVHIIGVQEGKILTDHLIGQSSQDGVAQLSVLERYGQGSKPANAYVQGFGESFDGAIVSSVGHDSHNLIAVGSNRKDIRVGMGALIASGGGFCVVKNGQVLSSLALPIGGLMSHRSPGELKKNLGNLKSASREIGCSLSEPFLQLAFLSLPVIPSLKLTDRGLVDVQRFQIIDVRAS